MSKTYVLDTNVLLSDANAISSFQDNNIILPLIVIEELDRHKDRQDEVGKNARETSRKLSKLIKEHKDLRKGIPLENNGTLKILSLDDFSKTKINLPKELDLKSGDNLILAFCKALQKIHPNLILVSRDILMQIKAETMGIPCENYKNGSPIKQQSDEMYSGVRTIELTSEQIELFYKNSLYFNSEFVEENLINFNEFLILKEKNGSKSGLARFVSTGKPLRKIEENKTAWSIKPKNKEQLFCLDLLYDDNIKLVTMSGPSGTGKTLLSTAAAIDQVLTSKKYKKIIITRTLQSVGQEMGYLPGSKEEKISPYVACFKDNLEFLLNEDIEDAKNKGATMKKGKKEKTSFMLQEFFDSGLIEMEAVSFVRGRSIPNCFIIVDEVQNMTLHELKTMVTRIGENSKLVLLGDCNQIDVSNLDIITNGLAIAINKFKNQELSGHVTLVRGERSALATLAAEIL